MIVADHGNAERWKTKMGCHLQPIQQIPSMYRHKKVWYSVRGNLGDVIPTMLTLLDIPQPVKMTGKTLIVK